MYKGKKNLISINRRKVDFNKDLEYIPYDQRKHKKRTLKSLLVGRQPSYYFYKRNAEEPNNNLTETRTTYNRCVMSYFKAIAELLMEYEGGVFEENFGYFVPIVLPWVEQGYKNNFNMDPMFHTDGRFYMLTMFTDCSTRTCMNMFKMDYSFDQNLKSGVGKRIYEDDFRPRLYYTSLKSSYGRKPRKKDKL